MPVGVSLFLFAAPHRREAAGKWHKKHKRKYGNGEKSKIVHTFRLRAHSCARPPDVPEGTGEKRSVEGARASVRAKPEEEKGRNRHAQLFLIQAGIKKSKIRKTPDRKIPQTVILIIFS